MSARRSETNEFHKRLIQLGIDCSKFARNEERHEALRQQPRFTYLRAPGESGDRAKRCLSEG
jgi:hypothetical protein